MTYELIQSLLTLLLEITAIAGLAGIFTHALYTAHHNWKASDRPVHHNDGVSKWYQNRKPTP